MQNVLAGGLAADQGCAGIPQPLSLQAVTRPCCVCSAINGKYMQGTRAHTGAGERAGRAGVGSSRALVERCGRTREQPLKHLCVCRLWSGEGPQLGQGEDRELS